MDPIADLIALAETEILASLGRMGLLAPGERPRLTRLSGGVSCDVFKVDLVRGPVCVKRALERLRVEAFWTAPLERSDYEVEWLKTAAAVEGVLTPEVLGHDPDAHLFVMTYLSPDRHRLWKSELAAGRVDLGVAEKVGAALGRVHRASAGSEAIQARFETADLFNALRIEPYLLAAAEANPGLKEPLERLAAETLARRWALVHGDVSPKNILIGEEGPIFLDAECAWFGDPAFDLAFVCAHLLLKAVWRPGSSERYHEALLRLARAYRAEALPDHAPAFDAPAFENRAAQLLAALLLARVDGKSPVEYLNRTTDAAFVRGVVGRLILSPLAKVDLVAQEWMKELQRR